MNVLQCSYLSLHESPNRRCRELSIRNLQPYGVFLRFQYVVNFVKD
jgi:hypothetical protein